MYKLAKLTKENFAYLVFPGMQELLLLPNNKIYLFPGQKCTSSSQSMVYECHGSKMIRWKSLKTSSLEKESSPWSLHLVSLEHPLIVSVESSLLQPLEPQGKPRPQLTQIYLLCILKLIPVWESLWKKRILFIYNKADKLLYAYYSHRMTVF